METVFFATPQKYNKNRSGDGKNRTFAAVFEPW
jgi:hypothetical protein